MRSSLALRTLAVPALLMVVLPVPGSGADSLASAATAAPTCGETTTTLTGDVGPSDAKTYQLHPFVVPTGTARVEVGYIWDPIDAGVLDLGVWDANGTTGKAAFRTWSGSREGRLDKSMPAEVIAPDRNERTVVPRAINAGTWHVELGIAAVSSPIHWRVEIRCPKGPAATPLVADPVDPTHVARAEKGWYAGDFHLHAYHSNPEGPDPDAMVAAARKAGLDIVPVTEYVTPAHWERLGAVQRANPDELIWPGREVITYFGHMIVLSETSDIEYRVGFNGVTIGDIQRKAAADGALVSIAHPTIFPPDTFGSACRGCFFQLLDQVDWPSTNLMEVVTEGSMAELAGKEIPNPFVTTATALWESELRAGHRLTAVSGSDSKTGPGYGHTSTMVYADRLSRPAVDEALRRGHAYVRGVGKNSPTIDMTATAPDGTTAMMGDTLVSHTATLKITVKGGNGDMLTTRRNGTVVQRIPIDSDTFTKDVAIARDLVEGPLGTFWGVEVLDPKVSPGTEVATVIANPVFLADHQRDEPTLPHFVAPKAAASGHVAGPVNPIVIDLPVALLVTIAVALIVAGGVTLVVIRRRRSAP